MSAPPAVPDGFDPRVRGREIASPPAASLPGWVEELLDSSPVVPLRGRGGRPDVRRRDANGWRQISTAVASARALDVLTFQQAVMDAFAAVFDQLGPTGAVLYASVFGGSLVDTSMGLAIAVDAMMLVAYW